MYKILFSNSEMHEKISVNKKNTYSDSLLQ